jgi:cytochrome P450
MFFSGCCATYGGGTTEYTESRTNPSNPRLLHTVKSNLSADPSKRLSDADLLDQLSTFLFAGSDTTALAMTWALHHLASNMDVQAKLREELMSRRLVNPANESYADTLDALPYLDAVVREVLRLSPPLHSTIRVATEDGVVPLSTPLRMRDGSWASEIAVRKGTYVHIPIEGLNHAEAVWGPDAKSFRPERWLATAAASPSPYVRAPPVQHHPGLAGMMTFSLGPHSCPGYKFAILETKVFLAELLPHFVFRPTEGVEVFKVNSIVTRPYVKSRLQEGPQMPVSVERYCHV